MQGLLLFSSVPYLSQQAWALRISTFSLSMLHTWTRALLSRGRYLFGNPARHVLILAGCYFLGLLFCVPSPPEAERLLCVPCFLWSLSAGLAGDRYEAPVLYHGKACGRTQTSAFTVGKRAKLLALPWLMEHWWCKNSSGITLVCKKADFPFGKRKSLYKFAVRRNRNISMTSARKAACKGILVYLLPSYKTFSVTFYSLWEEVGVFPPLCKVVDPEFSAICSETLGSWKRTQWLHVSFLVLNKHAVCAWNTTLKGLQLVSREKVIITIL